MTRPLFPLALGALLALGGCGKPEGAAKADKARDLALPPVAVETAAVEMRRVPRHLTLTASVVANQQAEVAANVVGRIASTEVERGQAVRKDQVIAVVDSRAAGLSAAAASAQASLADAQQAQARQDCARAEQLLATNAMARAEYDRLKTQCEAQLYSANAARANAQLAQKLAGDTQIRAPFAGVIGERYVNPGEYVQGPTKVASIYSLDPVRVTISVPETAIGLVKVGQTLEVHVAAYPDRGFPAVVRFVGPALRPQTRDLLVEATAANQEGLLRPGMFATVALLVGEETLPTVPEDAIVVEGTVKRMFLARDHQAFELVVRTGISREGRVAVIEPLDDKAVVIRHPPAGLHDGSAITTGGTTGGNTAAPAPAATPTAQAGR